jgi:hypothetical protein
MKINSWITTVLGQVLGIVSGYLTGGGEITWAAFAAYAVPALLGILTKTFTIGKKETV